MTNKYSRKPEHDRKATPHQKPSLENKSKDTTVARQCLNCAHTFQSSWIGNRLCPNCSRRS
jgi:hypothetical protein